MRCYNAETYTYEVMLVVCIRQAPTHACRDMIFCDTEEESHERAYGIPAAPNGVPGPRVTKGVPIISLVECQTGYLPGELLHDRAGFPA